MANALGYYNALLGKLFNNGTAMPLRGGLNFIGLVIEPSQYGYDISPDMAASQLDNDSGVSGSTVADALDTLNGEVTTNTAIIATNTTKIANLTVSGAGALPYVSGTPGTYTATAHWTTDGTSLIADSSGLMKWDVGANETYPTGGFIRVGFRTVANGGATVIQGIGENGTTGVQILRWNTEDGVILFGANNSSCKKFAATTTSTGSHEHRFGATAEWVFTAAQLDATSGAIVNLAALNGAYPIVPVEGTAITTTATINVSQGNQRAVTTSGAGYTITLGTTGSPYTGEGIWLYCSTATNAAVTITNGGGGGGNVGFSSGTIPSGFKGVCRFAYDGTNWALVAGSVVRFT
jgi:hypothetical protein